MRESLQMETGVDKEIFDKFSERHAKFPCLFVGSDKVDENFARLLRQWKTKHISWLILPTINSIEPAGEFIIGKNQRKFETSS